MREKSKLAKYVADFSSRIKEDDIDWGYEARKGICYDFVSKVSRINTAKYLIVNSQYIGGKI